MDTSSRPREGLNTDGDDNYTRSIISAGQATRTISLVPVPETALASSSPTLAPTHSSHDSHQNHLTPYAEDLLIAAGAIGRRKLDLVQLRNELTTFRRIHSYRGCCLVFF